MGILLVIIIMLLVGITLVIIDLRIGTEALSLLGGIGIFIACISLFIWFVGVITIPTDNSNSYYIALYSEKQTAETKAIISKHETMHENFFFNIFYPLKDE